MTLADWIRRMALRDIENRLRRIEQHLEKIMIAQTTIDTAITDLNTVVTAAVAALQGVAASTPDASVQGLLDGVGKATSTLATVLTPAPAASADVPSAPTV